MRNALLILLLSVVAISCQNEGTKIEKDPIKIRQGIYFDDSATGSKIANYPDGKWLDPVTSVNYINNFGDCSGLVIKADSLNHYITSTAADKVRIYNGWTGTKYVFVILCTRKDVSGRDSIVFYQDNNDLDPLTRIPRPKALEHIEPTYIDNGGVDALEVCEPAKLTRYGIKWPSNSSGHVR